MWNVFLRNLNMGTIRDIAKRILADLKEITVVAVVLVLLYLVSHHIFEAFCPMLILTGLPCAGCGLTRAGLFLLKGQVLRAAGINPSIFAVLFFLFYCGYFRYIKGTAMKGFKFVLTATVLFMLVVYVYGMYRYFPGEAPYVYQPDNLFARFIPGYRELMDRLSADIRSLKAALP